MGFFYSSHDSVIQAGSETGRNVDNSFSRIEVTDNLTGVI
jgi:hypothetical protein